MSTGFVSQIVVKHKATIWISILSGTTATGDIVGGAIVASFGRQFCRSDKRIYVVMATSFVSLKSAMRHMQSFLVNTTWKESKMANKQGPTSRNRNHKAPLPEDKNRSQDKYSAKHHAP